MGMVVDVSYFKNTLDNVKKYVSDLSTQEINELFNNTQEFNKAPENKALFNILNSVEFQELDLSDLSDFAQLIKVVGLDDHDDYIVLDYAYLYTSLLDYFYED